MRRLLCTLLLAGLVAAPGASAAIDGYVASSPVPQDRLSDGRVMLVLRSTDPLPLGAPARIGDRTGYLTALSPELGCYAAIAFVNRDRARDEGRAGDQVRVRVGKGGRLFDRRLEVRPMAGDLARGGPLGCAEDPATSAAYFDLTMRPQVEPDRVFFTANAGPYLRDLTWTGWGSGEAVGTGTYVSDCASCGPKQVLEARVVLSRPVACRGWGVRAYGRLRLEKLLEDGTVEVQRLGGGCP